jgi:hypothetical protein
MEKGDMHSDDTNKTNEITQVKDAFKRPIYH